MTKLRILLQRHWQDQICRGLMQNRQDPSSAKQRQRQMHQGGPWSSESVPIISLLVLSFFICSGASQVSCTKGWRWGRSPNCLPFFRRKKPAIWRSRLSYSLEGLSESLVLFHQKSGRVAQTGFVAALTCSQCLSFFSSFSFYCFFLHASAYLIFHEIFRISKPC